MARRLTNWQIAVVVLWSLGGATVRQHTEDVAVRCWQLAPQRFRMERYRQYPKLSTAAEALRDAKKKKNGQLVVGDVERGWLLTQGGVEWTRAHPDLVRQLTASPGTSALRQEDSAALGAVETSRVFQSWCQGSREFETYELADAIELPADAPRQVIRNRVDELSNAATLAGLEKLQEFLVWLRQRASRAS